MGLRITSRSRPRFDIPFGAGGITDVTSTDKSNWVGPMTLPQYVELLWRVRKITVTGSVFFTWVEDGDTLSGSHSLDVTLTRQAVSGSFPSFTYEDADEIDVFRDLMTPTGFVRWVNTYDPSDFLGHAVDDTFTILRDSSGQYWLKPWLGAAPDSSNESSVPAGVLREGTSSQADIGLSTVDYRMVSATIRLAGGDVSFPLLWGVGPFCDDVAITSATAYIAPTEWFPYADVAGSDAWNTATGEPANGGPGG